MLAEFLGKDILPEVRVKDDLQAKISSLTQTREKLVQLRTVLKNKVNNRLAAHFIVLKREELSTEKGLLKALSYHFDSITDMEMLVVVEPYLNAFHEAVKSQRGGANVNIALARKFLDIVYKTLKNNWIFEDFIQFKLVKN